MRTTETFQNITILNARIVNVAKASDLYNGNVGDVRKLAKFTPAYLKDGKYVPERFECILALNSDGRTAQYIPAVFWRRNAINMARFATAGQSIDLIEARLNINQAFVDSNGNTTTADASRSGQDTARTYVQLDVSNFRLGDMSDSEESEEVRLQLRPANWRNNADPQTQSWKIYMSNTLWNMIPDWTTGAGLQIISGAPFLGRAAVVMPKGFSMDRFKMLDSTDERVSNNWRPSGFRPQEQNQRPIQNQVPAYLNQQPIQNQAPAPTQNQVPAYLNQQPIQNQAPVQNQTPVQNQAPAQNQVPAYLNHQDQTPVQNQVPAYLNHQDQAPVQNQAPTKNTNFPWMKSENTGQKSGFANAVTTIASGSPNSGSFTGTAGC